MLKSVDAVILLADPLVDRTTMKLLSNIRNICVLKCDSIEASSSSSSSSTSAVQVTTTTTGADADTDTAGNGNDNENEERYFKFYAV